MEIKNTLNKLEAPYVGQLEQDKAETRQVAAGTDRQTASGDVVDIKSSSLKAAVASAALDAPDVRADKVASVQARLEDGSYSVDSRDIAAKMLQAGRELFE
ncbi:MAG: flagellar biosynthesis anti-sigma factor FlgM [Deltaproteobacteria bacterium]|jgi:negative regulator of flagellin synthesis FlgM|nr:flagellar biosynthesis anti-sigma factor FlgM [Deltaproteobacteria bacterium]